MMDHKQLRLTNPPPLSDFVADQMHSFICAFGDAFFEAYHDQLMRQVQVEEISESSDFPAEGLSAMGFDDEIPF